MLHKEKQKESDNQNNNVYNLIVRTLTSRLLNSH